MKDRKILVVGGAGYIGGALTSHIYSTEWRGSRYSTDWEQTVYDSLLYEDRYLNTFDFIFGDVRDTEKLGKIINNFAVVVWLAAIVGDGACAVNPSLTKAVNEDSVKWLVDNYRGKIVFMSTCSVYGINHDLIKEGDDTKPLSLYAATKLNAEKYILDNCDNALIYRLGTVFGQGDTYSRLRFDLVLNILTVRATLGETIYVFGGDQYRPLIHVKDVAGCIKMGIEHDYCGLFNLSAQNYQIKHLADYVKDVIPNTKVEYTEMPFEDTRNYRVCTDKFDTLAIGVLGAYRGCLFGITEIYELVKGGRIKDVENVLYSNHKYLEDQIRIR